MIMIFHISVLLTSFLAVSANEQTSEGKGFFSKKYLTGSSSTSVWQEYIDPIGIEAHELMSKWLESFYRRAPAGQLSNPPQRIPTTRAFQPTIPVRLPFHDPETFKDPHIWFNWNNTINGTGDCDIDVSMSRRTLKNNNNDNDDNYSSLVLRTIPRRFLIIVPVGDGFNAYQWMTHTNISTYDIIALYYGSKSDEFSCPLCKAVIPLRGPKWRLVYTFLDQNPSMKQSIYSEYEAVMVADDDLDLRDTCTINRLFEIFSAYDLLLAQPSLCPTPYRSTYYNHLYRGGNNIQENVQTPPSTVLRFVTFVEIMAPIFRMDFFESVVVPSLWDAYTGWGLDFVWPFLLRYPQRYIAVVDEICIVHKTPSGGGTLYAVTLPYSQNEEETRRAAQYGYYPSRVESMGFRYRAMETLGVVDRTVTNRSQLATLNRSPWNLNRVHTTGKARNKTRGIEILVVFTLTGVVTGIIAARIAQRSGLSGAGRSGHSASTHTGRNPRYMAKVEPALNM